MLKIVPEVPADAKSSKACAVAQAAEQGRQRAFFASNNKNHIKNKYALVIGFVI
jgi:hypothetical protein